MRLKSGVLTAVAVLVGVLSFVEAYAQNPTLDPIVVADDVLPDVTGTLTINAAALPVSLSDPSQNAQFTLEDAQGQLGHRTAHREHDWDHLCVRAAAQWDHSDEHRFRAHEFQSLDADAVDVGHVYRAD